MGSLEEQIWGRLSKAWLAWVLLVLVILIYLWVAGFDGVVFGPDRSTLLKYGSLCTKNVDSGEFWRLSTSLFLHGDLLHLGLNAVALLVLCRMAESVFGVVSTLGLFYFSGLLGAFLSWAMGAPNTVGASGAIFGLLTALSTFGWKYKRELPEELGITLRKKLSLFGFLNLILGLLILRLANFSQFRVSLSLSVSNDLLKLEKIPEYVNSNNFTK